MIQNKFTIGRRIIIYRKQRKDVFVAFKDILIRLWINIRYFYWASDILFLFIEKEKEALKDLSDEDYENKFITDRDIEQIKYSYEKAWEAKNFEIDLYWRRATYFWAFQIASFAGYFAVMNSKDFESSLPKNCDVLYFVISIGFITSLAWALINQGSKTWQRHWEIHVDMLEERITGPLYKIVTTAKTFSVSKINDLVSRFFVCVWLLMSFQYFSKYLTFNYFNSGGIDWSVSVMTILVIYFAGTMFLGYGRGRFGERKVKFYARKFKPQ